MTGGGGRQAPAAPAKDETRMQLEENKKREKRMNASRAGLSIDVSATGVTCIPRLEGYLICTSARCLQTPHSLGPKTTRGSRYRMSTSSTSTTSTVDGWYRLLCLHSQLKIREGVEAVPPTVA